MCSLKKSYVNNEYWIGPPLLQIKRAIFLMPDKFGAAMALVKSDVGGNISV